LPTVIRRARRTRRAHRAFVAKFLPGYPRGEDEENQEYSKTEQWRAAVKLRDAVAATGIDLFAVTALMYHADSSKP